MEQAVPLNGPPPSPLNAKPLLPPHLHDGLMALLDRALRTTGPLSVLHNPFVPETFAANLISAGLIYTEVDWTNPDGEIQVYVTHLLDLIYQRPEMVATSGHMDTSHRWFIHWTCVSYKKLMLEKSLLPTPPPSPPATPPSAPQPTYASSLASPTPAESRNMTTPRHQPSLPTPPAAPTPHAPITGPRARTELLASNTVMIRHLPIATKHLPTKDPITGLNRPPKKSDIMRYLEATNPPAPVLENIKTIEITPIKHDIKISYHTNEMATTAHDLFKQRFSGFRPRPGKLRPSVYYYHKAPAHQAARQAAKAAIGANSEDDFNRTFAALEIRDRISDSKKATSKCSNQVRTYANKIQALATKFHTDDLLAAAAASVAHLVATATSAVDQVTAAAETNDADGAASAAATAASAAAAAKAILTSAIPKQTPHNSHDGVDPPPSAAASPTTTIDLAGMEGVETALVPFNTLSPASSTPPDTSSSAITVLASDQVTDMDLDLAVVTPTAKRASPFTPPRPHTHMDDDVEDPGEGNAEKKQKGCIPSPPHWGLRAAATAFKPSSASHPTSR